MTLSPEQLTKLREITTKIENEHEREKFNVLCAQLIAVFEETDRQDEGRAIA
jgi:hypothetical protein